MRVIQAVVVNVANFLRGIVFRGLTRTKGRGKAIWFTRKAQDAIASGAWHDAVFFSRVAVACDPTLPDGYLMLGFAYRSIGEPARARETLEQGIRSAPDSYRLDEQLGDLELSLHRFAEAETAYRRALELHPDNPQLLRKLGTVVSQQDSLGEAESLLAKALAGAPEDVLL